MMSHDEMMSHKLAGRFLVGLNPLALRARGFKPTKTLLPVY
jgi:hypothetical protein